VSAIVAWVGVVVELFDDGLQMGGFSIGEIGVALAKLFDERAVFFNPETGMERDEDGVVLGSTSLPGSQRLHR
jgi:hypothetical protein